VKEKTKDKGLTKQETITGLRNIVFGSSVSVIEMVGFLDLIKFELISNVQIRANRMKAG